MAPTIRRRTLESPRVLHVIELDLSHDKECMLCGHKEINEMLYGHLYQINDVVFHYFCLLLTPLIVVIGDNREETLEYLYNDLKKKIHQGSRKTCTYCKKMGATITCCGPKCRKTFHLPCGLKNGSLHQYYLEYKSYCKQHRMTQTVDKKDFQSSKSVECVICKDNVKPNPSPSTLLAPCCKKSSWFHRDCVQELALSAGYKLKCPLCNDAETFIVGMLCFGIYVPYRNASWVTDPNAFEEPLERSFMCNAVTCLCPHQRGRNYYQVSGSWKIILCHTCGSNGIHKQCSLLICNEIWYCSTCSVVAEGPESKKRRLEIKNVSSNSVSTIRYVASSSSQNSNTHRSNASDLSTNVETRESTRLNNNSNNNTINNRLQMRLLNARQLGDPIIISDSDDSSSNVEVINVVQPPRTFNIHPMPVTSSQNQLPIISRNLSISATNSTIINTYHRNSVIISPRNIIPRLYERPTTCDIIDLTMVDDDDDDGDNNGHNNDEDNGGI